MSEHATYADDLAVLDGLIVCDSASSGTVYQKSMLAAAGVGKCLGFSGYNSLASAQWIFLVDTTTTPPASTAAPIFVMTVPATSNFNQSWGTGDTGGIPFYTGLVICNSTAAPTLTIGAANCFFSVQYLLAPV